MRKRWYTNLKYSFIIFISYITFVCIVWIDINNKFGVAYHLWQVDTVVVSSTMQEDNEVFKQKVNWVGCHTIVSHGSWESLTWILCCRIRHCTNIGQLLTVLQFCMFQVMALRSATIEVLISCTITFIFVPTVNYFMFINYYYL